MEGSGGRKTKAPSPLKISRDSRVIRKPPVPLPAVQLRKPVIIHTYSPKIIETDANNFMWLVQRLTGSSDTQLRCKSNKPPAAPGGIPTDAHQDADFKPRVYKNNHEDLLSWKTEEREVSESSGVSEFVGEDDTEQQQQQQQQQFRVDQLLVSPTSSSDSGLFNSSSRICAPAMASPKSPLVSFDAAGALNFQFSGDHHQHLGSAAAVSSSSSSESTVSSSLHQMSSGQLQFPWSPIPTPNGITHDILNDFPSLDLWTGASSDAGIGCSPHTSRLFGPITSPASSMAFRDMAFGFLKDTSSS